MAKSLRVFVSSPGDVLPERRRAQLVIEKLAKAYARFFSIESVLWELEPMLVSGHFQDQIIPPSECDIVVLLVWSRLGTSLPPKTETREYRGIDGRVPVTGTEWEFEDALASQKKRGAPDLLAYRKQVDPTVSLKDKVAKAQAEQQWDQLETFWSRWFVNRGQFRAGFSEFIDLDGFEAKLESDLKSLIERRIAVLEATGHGAPPATWYAGSPFRGLESYRFEHAPIFFGRSAIIKAAVEHAAGSAERGRAFLLVLGASGAGKSSLVQAGVLPALTGRGIVPGVGLWRRAVMRPAGHPDGPFAALAQALLAETALPELPSATQNNKALARHLRSAADDPAFSLVRTLDQIEVAARARGDLLAIESARLAVVIDQLEELFTTGDATAEDRLAFVHCLDGFARSGRIFVIATMRSDYWHRAAEAPLLVDMAAGNGRLDLLAPTQDEIMEMIRQPAEVAGLAFERDPTRDVKLDATLAADAANEPGALPLLSFLLDELYKKNIDARAGKTLTFASMKELGGLKGAVANRAEAVLSKLPTDVQEALPGVLRALVTVRGTEPTARPAPLERFPANSPARRVIDALLDPQVRLLVAEGDGGGARVRLAHEALITYWERAKRQLAQDRDDLRTRAMVEEAHVEWSRADRKRKYLLRDPLLANAVDLASRWRDQFEAGILDFVQVSRRRARLRQQLSAAAAVIFAVVSAFAIFAARQAAEQTRVAQEQTKLALEQRQVASDREKFASEQKSAAEAAKFEADAERDRVKLTEAKLLTVLANEKVSAGDAVTGILLAEEAYALLSDKASDADRAEAERSLFSAVQAQREVLVLPHSSALNYAEFSPDGTRVASMDRKGVGRLWNSATGEHVAALNVGELSDGGKQEEIFSPDDTIAIQFSPDGRMLVTIGQDRKYAFVWNAFTGSLISKIKAQEPIAAAIFTPDSRRIATLAGEVAQLWDLSGQPLKKMSFPDKDINGGARPLLRGVFNLDGRRLAIGTNGGSAVVWEIDSRGKFAATDGCKNSPGAFSPDSQRIVMSEGCSGSNKAIVWSAINGRKLLELVGHTGFVNSAAYSPDGKRILTAAQDSTARIWDATSGRTIAILPSVNEASYDRSGRYILTASGDKTARVLNADNGAEIARLGGHLEGIVSARFSSDGQHVVTASSDGTVRIWRVPLANSARVLKQGVTEDSDQYKPGDLDVTRATLSPDSKQVAAGDFRGRIAILDMLTGEQLKLFRGDSSSQSLNRRINSLVYTLDGGRLLAAGDETARIWDVAAGKEILALKGHTEEVKSARFDREENRIVTASDDGTVRIWNAGTGALLQTLVGAGTYSLQDAVFSADGRWVVARSNSGIYRWHDGELIKEPFETKGDPENDPIVRAMMALGIRGDSEGTFIGDGVRVLTINDDGVRIFDVKSGNDLGKLYEEKESVTSVDVSSSAGPAVLVDRDVRGKAGNTWRIVLVPFFDSAVSMREYARSTSPRCLTTDQLRRYLHADAPPAWCAAKWPYRAGSGAAAGK